MENLTRHQIVLLTLLVSFVTSMATGIVAVALMNQAPVGVTQTINRVVQTTVEKIVSQPATSTSNTGQQIVKETVIVNSDDAVVSAVDKNTKSLVRLYRTNSDPSLGLSSMNLVGLGVVVTDDGIIATDENIITKDSGRYFTPTDDGQLHEISILRSVSGEQIALLKIKPDTSSSTPFVKANLSSEDVKLGQSVVYIGGSSKNTVATGIVSSIGTKDAGQVSSTDSTAPALSYIETSVSQNFVPGSILLDLSGDLVGIKTTYLSSAQNDLFAPASDIQDALDAIATSSNNQ